MKRQVEVRDPDTGEFILYQWVTKAWCKKGHFGMRFSEDLSPFLLGLVGQYTLYELGAILRMTSFYAMRLFELIKQWEVRGHQTFSLAPELTKNEPSWDNFPKFMGYDHKKGSYTRFSNLKQRVIEPAIAQVQNLTEFKKISYKVIRFNRRPIAIKFTWETSQGLQSITGHPLFSDMKAIGVSPATARSIFVEYDEEKIGRNLAYTKEKHRKGSVDNPAAYFVQALKEDFADPEFSGWEAIKPVESKQSQIQSKRNASGGSHPLYSSCSNENEFRKVLAAETERGEPFEDYNEFFAYDMSKRLGQR
jgi:plasmid replication initiation protein